MGKWHVSLAPNLVASHCLKPYYMNFDENVLRNVGVLDVITNQRMSLNETISITKIYRLPDGAVLDYS